MTLNHWPVASGAGSTEPWRAFIEANPSLNGARAEARAHRRQVHEVAMVDPAYAARRYHPMWSVVRANFEVAMAAMGEQFAIIGERVAAAGAVLHTAFRGLLTPEMIAELEAMPDATELAGVRE